jgi:hypothetical protein
MLSTTAKYLTGLLVGLLTSVLFFRLLYAKLIGWSPQPIAERAALLSAAPYIVLIAVLAFGILTWALRPQTLGEAFGWTFAANLAFWLIPLWNYAMVAPSLYGEAPWSRGMTQDLSYGALGFLVFAVICSGLAATMIRLLQRRMRLRQTAGR